MVPAIYGTEMLTNEKSNTKANSTVAFSTTLCTSEIISK